MMRTNSADVRDMNVASMIQTLTGGRPYVFVIISYPNEEKGRPERKKLYECISEVVEQQFGMACIRADHVMSSGYDLLNKIQELIMRAEVVIAEISEESPNVYYEIGFAVGVDRQPILLMEKRGKVPTDLRGLEVVEYEQGWDGIEEFRLQLHQHLRFRVSTDLALLRDMLEAPAPQPSYIVASPKYPGAHSRILGQVYDRRTFGDHLGILGLITAFGSMWGQRQGVELISAQHAPPDLLKQPQNLYLIGSRKVNKDAGILLDELQQGREPLWSFGNVSRNAPERRDWLVGLYRTIQGQRVKVEGKTISVGKDPRDVVWTEDYGIIVRGPHPHHPRRLALVLAGAHSLGTGAACMAATRSSLIQKIKTALPADVLEDKEKTFWVLVKGTVNSTDYLLDEDGVTIEEAGVYASAGKSGT
jgi:hypothetical protein